MNRRLVAGLVAAAVSVLAIGAAPAHAAGLDPNRCAKLNSPPTTQANHFPNVGDVVGGPDIPSPDTPGIAGEPTGGNVADPFTGPSGSSSEHGLCDNLMETLVPGPNSGPQPTSHYDLGYDEGGALSLWRKVSGFIMDQTFALARWMVRLGIWIENWALSFQFTDKLAGPAAGVAANYQSKVVGPLGLEVLFLTAAALWAMWLGLTGRLTRGLAEFGVSILIAAAAATIWSHPAAYLTNATKFTANLSFEVAAVTTADPNPADHRIGATMERAIHHAFVEVPHQILDWGRPIPPGDKCRATYDAAVASGPWGTADEPRDAMKKAGCVTEYNFNHDPTSGRILGAVVVAFAALLAMVLLILVAATLVGAQIAVLGCICVAPFAFLAGCLPGRGRSLFWAWVGTVGAALGGVMAMAILLSLTLVGIDALVTATANESMLVQLGVIDLVVVVALFKRRRILEKGRSAVAGFTHRMSGSQMGGGHQSWVRSAGGGAAVGFGVDEMVHGARAHGQRAARAVGGVHRNTQRRRLLDATTGGGESSLEVLRTMNDHTVAQRALLEEDVAARTARDEEGLSHSARQTHALEDLVAAFNEAR